MLKILYEGLRTKWIWEYCVMLYASAGFCIFKYSLVVLEMLVVTFTFAGQ